MKIKSADRECLKDGLCLLTPGGGGSQTNKHVDLQQNNPFRRDTSIVKPWL